MIQGALPAKAEAKVSRNAKLSSESKRKETDSFYYLFIKLIYLIKNTKIYYLIKIKI